MFINYLRLNLIRFFKGRSAKVAIVASVGLMIVLTLLIGLILYAARAQISLMAEQDLPVNFYTFAQLLIYGLSFVYVPIISGLVGCGYISAYYAYRGYYNLEIGMRNRVLFVLSELVVLFLMSAILYGMSSMLLILMEPLALNGQSLLEDGYKFVAYTYGVQLILGLNDSANALLFAHLFRRKGKSFIFYLIFWIASLFLSHYLVEWLPTSFDFLTYILFPSVINWFAGDVPLIAEEISMTNTIIYIGTVLKIMATFALAVMLFNRKVEEKRS
ncbi:MAG: hypothetical protein K6G47_09830 [Clostridia bacterium]|nr:hypothetical protein [Clostridia bacterium]